MRRINMRMEDEKGEDDDDDEGDRSQP